MSNLIPGLIGGGTAPSSPAASVPATTQAPTPISSASTSAAVVPTTAQPATTTAPSVVTPSTRAPVATSAPLGVTTTTAAPTTVVVVPSTTSSVLTTPTSASSSSRMITVTSATTPLFTTTTQTSTIPFAASSGSSSVALSPTGVSNASSGSSNAGAIAGGVIGGLAGLAALIALVWFFCFKGRRSDDKFEFAAEDDNVWSPARGSGIIGGGSTRNMEQYQDHDEPRNNRVMDEQNDYYNQSSNGHTQASNPRYTAQPGMAGVGVIRRNASSTSQRAMIEDSNGYDGILDSMTTEASGGGDGGYGVASRIGRNSIKNRDGRQPRSEQYPDGYSPEMAQVEQQFPVQQFPLPGTGIQYNQAPKQFNRLNAENSPVPSHRSLPGGYVPNDNEEEPRSALRVMNEDAEEDFYDPKVQASNPYSNLTDGLATNGGSTGSLRTGGNYYNK